VPPSRSRPQLGVVFPQTELGGDVAVLRTWATTVEELGFEHVMIYDHVVGADPAVHVGWAGAYDVDCPFHEPLVLFGYLAGITSMELLTGVLVLPQRQTVLVAKQAAQVDILCSGRLRLGVGIGWNRVEYEALGIEFARRGKRLEEQVDLMRRLWSEPSVSFVGEMDRVTGAGLAPLPVQRPIPVWFGGNSAAAYRRAGRMGDGWIPDKMVPGALLAAARAVVDDGAREAGRDPAAVGMQGRVRVSQLDPAERTPEVVAEQFQGWHDAGATHVAIDLTGAKMASMDEQLRFLEACRDALRPA
jgi:probable F420-dependent oxidoreductase